MQFYKDIEANKGKVPVFEYTNQHEELVLKAITINIPLFKFLGWKDRPADFVVPVWDNPEPLIADGQVSMNSDVAALVTEAEKENGLDFDDIPF